MQKLLHLISLGCSKNLVDSEIMLYGLQDYEITPTPKDADLIIVNTCGFIESAKAEGIATILEVGALKKQGALLIVAGCLAQRYADELKREIKEIDIITGVSNFDKIAAMIEDFKSSGLGDIESKLIKPNKTDVDTEASQAASLASSAGGIASKTSDNIASKTSDNTASGDTSERGVYIKRWSTAKDAKVFLPTASSFKRIVSNSSIATFVKLSEGCNQNCGFCAIPLIKGRLHSRGIGGIINEINYLVEQGIKDISFIAQDSSSYLLERDANYGNGQGLIELISHIDIDTDLYNARILYLYPNTTSHALIDAIANSKTVQSYYDIPLQHITDDMLEAMRRYHDSALIHDLLGHMSEVEGAFIRSTFIIGHPSESESDFKKLCDFIESAPFDRVNAFAYSCEENTASSLLPQVPAKVIEARAKALENIIDRKLETAYKALVGKKLEVIIDGVSSEGEYFYSARDRRWAKEIDGEILINDSELEGALAPGIYEAKVTDFTEGYLLGCALKKINV